MKTHTEPPPAAVRLAGRLLRRIGSVLTIACVLGTLAYLGTLAWREFIPRKPTVNAVRRDLADAVLNRAVSDLQAQPNRIPGAALLHFRGDTTDHLTDRMRDLLDDSGVLNLVGPTLDEKLQRRLGLQVTSPDSLESAVARARGLGVPAVLFGVVRQFEGTSEGGRLMLELTLADIATKAVLFTKTYEQTWNPTMLEPLLSGTPVQRSSTISRLLGWTLVVLLLPVFTIGFLRATVRRNSNRSNLGVLTLYASVATVLAVLLFGIPSGIGSILSLLTLSFLAFCYQVWVMTFALRLES